MSDTRVPFRVVEDGGPTIADQLRRELDAKSAAVAASRPPTKFPHGDHDGIHGHIPIPGEVEDERTWGNVWQTQFATVGGEGLSGQPPVQICRVHRKRATTWSVGLSVQLIAGWTGETVDWQCEVLLVPGVGQAAAPFPFFIDLGAAPVNGQTSTLIVPAIPARAMQAYAQFFVGGGGKPTLTATKVASVSLLAAPVVM
jgi:hypothetical protein